MSIVVSLKEGRHISKGSAVDPIDAQMDYIAAQEDLASAGLALAALSKTEKDLEKAENFAQAVASKDPALASVVAHEMVSLALANIGQDAYTSDIVPAHEDYSVAEENIKDTIKSVWEKIKEFTKKVWEFIRNLIAKVFDFVKSIFGKEGSSYQELEKLLTKLKKEGKTYLEKDEFEKSVRERLAEKVGGVLLKNKGKKLNGAAYTNYLDEGNTLLGTAASAKPTTISAGISINTSDNKITIANSEIEIATGTDGAKTVSGAQAAIKAIMKALGGVTDDYDNTKLVFGPGAKEPWASVKDDVEDKVNQFEAGFIISSCLRDSKIGFTIIGVKEDGVDAYKSLTDGIDLNKARAGLKKFFGNVEITYVEVKPSKTDIVDEMENVIPVDYAEAVSIKDKMKDLGKKAETNAEKIKNNIDKIAKEANKAIDNLAKELEKDESSDIATVVNSVLPRISSLEASFYRNHYKGLADTALSFARNNIADVVKESARLYTKK